MSSMSASRLWEMKPVHYGCISAYRCSQQVELGLTNMEYPVTASLPASLSGISLERSGLGSGGELHLESDRLGF
jgi:hypothetical protein